MAFTTPNSAIRTMGDLPDVPGFERVGAVAARVVEQLAADLHCEPARFWFVWTKTGRVPRFAHDTYAAATAEAARLARANPGKKFIVLEAVQKIVAAPPEQDAA